MLLFLLFQLGMMEDELKLKLQMKSIKEQFLHLLSHFEAFEERQLQLETYMNAKVESARTDRVRHRSYDKRTPSGIEKMPRGHPSGTPRGRASSNRQGYMNHRKSRPERGQESRREIATSSVELSLNEYSWSPTKQDMMAQRREDSKYIDIKDLTQLSAITKYSTQSDLLDGTRGNITGPLQSTLNYPQHSTPEKLRKLLEASISLFPDLTSMNPGTASVSSVQPFDLTAASEEQRPLPTGGENTDKPRSGLTPPISAAIPWNKVLSDHFDSSGEKTPVNTFPAKSRLIQEGNSNNDSGIIANEGSVTFTSVGSREHYMSQAEAGAEGDSVTPVGQTAVSSRSDDSSASSTKKMRRQSALPDIYSPHPPRILSETVSEASDSIQQPHFSIEATRHSVADASAITSTGSELGPPLSDTTASEPHLSSLASDTVSSFKESDAQPSPDKSVDDPEFSLYPGDGMIDIRSDCSAYCAPQNSLMGPQASLLELSLARTDSLLGALAPTNSPNNTDFSISSRPTLDSVDTADSADHFKPSRVTGRPPIMGGEGNPRSKRSGSTSSGSSRESTSRPQPSRGFSVKVRSKTKVMIEQEIDVRVSSDSSGSRDSLSSSYDHPDLRTPTNKASWQQYHNYETDKTPTNIGPPPPLYLDQGSDSSDKDRTPKVAPDTPSKLKSRGSNVRRSFSKKIKNIGRQIKGRFKSKNEVHLWSKLFFCGALHWFNV